MRWVQSITVVAAVVVCTAWRLDAVNRPTVAQDFASSGNEHLVHLNLSPDLLHCLSLLLIILLYVLCRTIIDEGAL